MLLGRSTRGVDVVVSRSAAGHAVTVDSPTRNLCSPLRVRGTPPLLADGLLLLVVAVVVVLSLFGHLAFADSSPRSHEDLA